MTVVLENTAYEEALEQPFLTSLLRNGALLTNLRSETHPSQPNYIALISGSTQGVTSDKKVDLDGRHLGDLLEAKGLQWRVYAEHYPGRCFLGKRAGTYVRKHVPFLSFTNIQRDPARCARVVEAAQLAKDIEAGTLPDYSLYIPDINNDGHDTGAEYADNWLFTTFGPLLTNPKFTKNMLLIVTFDEDKHYVLFPSSQRVFTVLLGSDVMPNSWSDVPYTHYSLLRLVEDRLGLGTLGLNDATATAIRDIWRD